MEYNKIETLLDSYWEGTTSLEEEKTLVEFFNGNEVPKHLKEYQPLFQFIQVEKTTKVSDSFEDNLFAAIEKEDTKTTSTSEEKDEVKVRKMWTPLLRIAATVALVFGMFFMYQNSHFDQPNDLAMADTFETPEEAYAETMKALKLVSKKLNKGSKTTIKTVKGAGSFTKILKKKKRK